MKKHQDRKDYYNVQKLESLKSFYSYTCPK